MYYVEETKVLISCRVTAQLICAFVFAYAKSMFSRDKVHVLNFVYSSFASVLIFG